MIAIKIERDDDETNWRSSFVTILPEIEQKLRLAFCRLDVEAREDAVEEGIVHSLLAFMRLSDKGRAESVSPSNLAWYSSRQVKRGRPAAGKMNGKDVLSRYAQIGNGIQIESAQSNWMDTLVADKRASVADQVAAKMDVGHWFQTLTERMRQIAKELAFGFSTSEVAKKHKVSAGRISQLRRILELSWRDFQRETVREVV